MCEMSPKQVTACIVHCPDWSYGTFCHRSQQANSGQDMLRGCGGALHSPKCSHAKDLKGLGALSSTRTQQTHAERDFWDAFSIWEVLVLHWLRDLTHSRGIFLRLGWGGNGLVVTSSSVPNDLDLLPIELKPVQSSETSSPRWSWALSSCILCLAWGMVWLPTLIVLLTL